MHVMHVMQVATESQLAKLLDNLNVDRSEDVDYAEFCSKLSRGGTKNSTGAGK